MNSQLSPEPSPESAPLQEVTPKINFPPKPVLVSSLSSDSESVAPTQSNDLPPTIPTKKEEKTSSFSISFPLALASILAALLALAVQLWILF